MFENERKYCFFTGTNEFFIDDALYYVYAEENELLLNVALNSTLFWIIKEILSRPPEGLGVLQMKVYHYSDMPIFNLSALERYRDKIKKIFDSLANREIQPIFTELGFNPDKPIRSQEPHPLFDRAALDKIVFDELGLTEEERKEVYWSVAELVKGRLDKAKSLKKKR